MTLAWQAATASRHARSPLLRWLVNLGGLGLFAVAIVDSSVIPLPLPGSSDLLLLLLASHRRTTVMAAAGLALWAFAGSMIGGYLTWSAGRKGGEVALDRYIPRRFLPRIRGIVQKHGIWSVAVATILPPPVPLTPFLLAAGALGMGRTPYLLSYGAARAIRYSLLAWLGLTYGRQFVRLWQRELNGWSTPILWTYGALIVLGILYGIWKLKRHNPGDRTSHKTAEDAA